MLQVDMYVGWSLVQIRQIYTNSSRTSGYLSSNLTLGLAYQPTHYYIHTNMPYEVCQLKQ